MEDFGSLLSKLQGIGHEAVSEIEQRLQTEQQSIMAFLDRLKQHTIQYPEPIFAVLRRVKPTLIVKNFALVTRFEDVQEVLMRDEIFQVTYGEKMRVITGGRDFFLGMQDSPEYTRDVSHMRSVMRREDIPGRVAPFVSKQAESLVAAAGAEIDVVTQLTKTVPARWVGDYFGCPPPSDEELAEWGSAIFRYLFTDLTNDPAVGEAAKKAAAATRDWLDRTIADRKKNPNGNDDVLNRCLALQKAGAPGMDDLGIRNNLLGLLTGAIPTTSKCCTQALDELLKRPDALEGARRAALGDDDALLASYVFEALRFNPNNPGVFRIASEDYVVAKGTLRATKIPKGTTVLPATQSAMFDECHVEAPHEFRVGRPLYLDMHFGYGMHTCFGQYVNRVQIPGILKPLLRRKVRRAGELQYEGPFPSSLRVRVGD
ncbi:MAG TPA: cytochrome P450 [Bryobacteraceae bacterium]|nr:cytochrome P450 [Bryobacteraceae bacterium]